MQKNSLSSRYVEVILPLALPKCFTYGVPESFHQHIKEGQRVVVEFGKKKLYTGLVKSIHTKRPQHYRVKNILDIPDQKPIIDPIHFLFWDWIASYYMCSLGEIMKAALPSGFRLESETLLFPAITFKKKEGQEDIQEKEDLLLKWISEENKTTLEKAIQAGFSFYTINKMLCSGQLTAEEKLIDTYKPRKASYVNMHPSSLEKETFNALFDNLNKAPKQLDLLLTYLKLSGIQHLKNPKEVSKTVLLETSNSSSAILQTMVQKKIFQVYDKNLDRLPATNNEVENPIPLNDHQEKALKEINDQFQFHSTILLHGVTSSGKTEIYIHLIQEQLAQNKQVLYLLPEIALTTQIIKRLKAVFGDKVGVYHSKFSSSERTEIWEKTGNNQQYQIILGVRSSIFIPFQNLGLILVDEEHETSYKQFDPAPRYHARDCAIYLGTLHKAKVLLGTATPSIESYYNAQLGKYGLVTIHNRYKNIQLPAIELVDTYQARKKNLMVSHFSKRLLEEIRISLDKKEQVILFQNRRGYSPFYQCETCGWIPYCPNCNVSLTFHKFQDNLACHYCGYQHKTFTQCEACGSNILSAKGFGTEKIEDEIQTLFPTSTIKRLDLDTTRRKHAYEDIIGNFESGQIDILIGTQMISKGLNFENVNLVGILNADNLLNFPDFRAFERSFQLISQVAGRAGRSHKQGRVIIQTSMVDHDILIDVLDNQFLPFYKKQLIERKNFHYPPYFRLIRIAIKHKEEEETIQAATRFYQLLNKKLGNRVLPSNAPLVNKINKYYIRHIIIKIEKNISYQSVKNIINQSYQQLATEPLFKKSSITYDVDPF